MQTENSAKGTVIDQQEIRALPLPTRNFQQLLTLTTGTSGPLQNSSELGRGDVAVYVNGQRALSNNVIINGVDANSIGTGENPNLSVPSIDSLQEFIVQTSMYDASAGRNAGGNVAAVTKSGGPHVCLGYWNNPGATAKALDPDGWFHSGDLARCDEDGFFYIAGRSKDMIISGGVNIYPAEIEKELLDHPAIAEASVLGTPDEKWGEVPIAFVALKSGVSVSGLELIEFLRPRIGKIKLPRQIVVINALPRNAYGKVLKLELQSRLRNLKPGADGSYTVTPERESS